MQPVFHDFLNFLFKISFFMFLYRSNMMISKIIFKKCKKIF
jgi:hypothetical protein